MEADWAACIGDRKGKSERKDAAGPAHLRSVNKTHV